MVITYCERCGCLIRAPDEPGSADLCPDCTAGRPRRLVRTRDSGQIPYAQRPSTGAILREIRETVRRG